MATNLRAWRVHEFFLILKTVIGSSLLRFASLIGHIFVQRQAGAVLDGRAIAARDFLFPFSLELDSEKKTLTVSKRNWFVVGVDTKSFNFGQIRNVLVDEHLLTASLTIRVYAGKIECHWLSKADANRFKDAVMATRGNAGDGSGVFRE